MLSALLLYSGHVSNAKEAIEFFGRMRASDGHGVTLPSQLRYIGFFGKVFDEYYKMHVEMPVSPRKHLHRVVIHKTPSVDRDGGCDLYFDIHQEQRLIYSGKSISGPRRVVRQDVFVFDDLPLVLRGDLRFHFYDRDLIGRSTELFYFWTNTLFEPKRVSRFSKYEIDKAHKDHKSKIFRPDFAVELYFEEGD
jgi:phosphatidylinositol-3,4,5-trisphosphate 3-phosphatase and dual-specificity protein phosphatase PTEN